MCMARFVTIAALGALLSACALEPIPGMALKCQTTECVCVARDADFLAKPGLDTVDIIWQDNGDASCPDGHVLREAKKDK